MINLMIRASLKEAFELAGADAFYPTREELDTISFSAEFETRVGALLKRQEHFWFRTFNTIGKQVAAVLLAVVLALSAVTVSVEALREPFFEFLIETFERFTLITFHENEDQPEDEFIPLEPIDPTYIPEGFELVQEDNGFFSHTKTFKNKEHLQYTYSQTSKEGLQMYLDTEDATSKKIHIQSHEGILVYENNNTILFFTDEQYTYEVSGNIPENELIKIAESIPIQ